MSDSVVLSVTRGIRFTDSVSKNPWSNFVPYGENWPSREPPPSEKPEKPEKPEEFEEREESEKSEAARYGEPPTPAPREPPPSEEPEECEKSEESEKSEALL